MPRNYADADEFMTFLDSRIIICPTNEGVSFFRIKKDGTFIAEEVEEEDIDTFNLTASLGLLRRKRMDRIASLKKRIKKLVNMSKRWISLIFPLNWPNLR